MKVALIAGSYPPDIKGGGEISTEILAGILTAEGCEVTVLTCAAQAREDVDGGISVRRIVSPNLYWDVEPSPSRVRRLGWHVLENVNPRAERAVAGFLRETQPDILVTSTIENFGAAAWTAARRAGIPSAHVLRSYYPFCYRGNAVRDGANCSGRCADCAVLSFGRRIASQHVDGVVAISRYILERHRAQGFFRASASAIIGEPISPEFFRRRTASGAPRRFGYLGILSADKGLETLAAAWTKAALADASLSIAGRGKPEYVAHLREIFGAGVDFRGWVDAAEYLDQIDYLIVPSIWNEPFGRIVIEAFAAGVPVIGSRIGGIAETVVDGRNGMSFAPGDAGELAALLQRGHALTTPEYERLSHGARDDVERFESSTIARAHITFYRELLSHSKR